MPNGGRTGSHQSNNLMTTLEIKGDWNITKGKLKQKWGTLSEDDLRFAEDQFEELIGRIQKRTGESREAVARAIKEATEAPAIID